MQKNSYELLLDQEIWEANFSMNFKTPMKIILLFYKFVTVSNFDVNFKFTIKSAYLFCEFWNFKFIFYTFLISNFL